MAKLLRWRGVAGAFLCATVAVGAADQAIFRSRVDLVTVDATVIGHDGQPLHDLLADDFSVLVDGRRRPIVSVQFIQPLEADTGIEPLRAGHFSSSEDDQGRLLVIAVDEAHIRRLEGRPALRAAATFLDTLPPSDRVAVNGLSRLGVIEFSRDRATLKRRLDTLLGQTDPVFLQFTLGLVEAVEIADGSRARLADVVQRECGRALTEYLNQARATDDTAGRDACPEQVEQEARAVAQHARTQARISLDALQALIATLKPLDGPKAIALLSEGMVIDSRLIDVSDLAAKAHEARVAIYALHLDPPLFEASQQRVSPTLLRDVDLRGDGLARLAGATRGAVYRLVGSDPRPFQRIANELSSYYLLAFEAEPADRDGRLHALAVQVRAGASVVRSRPAFRLPEIVPSARSREEDLVRLLRASRPVSELPVRVSTYTFAEPGSSQLRVVVSADADTAGDGAPELVVGYVLMDQQGVIVASGAQRVPGGRHAFSTIVAPGTYTLRVGAIDQFDRRGLALRPFAAAVNRQAGLLVSDLMLAPTPPQTAATLRPFVDRVEMTGVTAYLELGLDGPAPSAVDVAFEIAGDSGGEAVRHAAGLVDRRNPRLAIARAALSLDGLPAGRYLARARIRVAGQPAGLITRPFMYRPK